MASGFLSVSNRQIISSNPDVIDCEMKFSSRHPAKIDYINTHLLKNNKCTISGSLLEPNISYFVLAWLELTINTWNVLQKAVGFEQSFG